MITSLLHCVILALLDRVRGDSFGLGKGIEQAVYAWYLAFVIGHGDTWLTIPIVIMFVLGASIGWGKPIGEYLSGKKNGGDYEWWQRGILEDNTFLALCARGVLWGGGLVGLGIFTQVEIIAAGLACMFAFPMSAAIAKNLPHNWETMEYIRGFLIGALSLIIIGGL